MIKSLKIRNFQSHEKTDLEFSDGVNIIVGSSDSGKSAIIRSLRWACWNKPSGNSFCSTWGGETSCELTTDEGEVIRSKGKKDKYVIRRSDGRETLFEAFGTNVPDEIALFLNLDEINLQYQLDAPFLLSLPPGQVAQHFNTIAKLDQIDRGLFNINKAVRDLEGESRYENSDLEGKEAQLLQFSHLPKMEADIEVLEEMDSRIKQQRSSLSDLSGKVTALMDIRCGLEDSEEILSLEEPLIKVLSLITDRDESKKKLTQLSTLLTSIDQTRSDIHGFESLTKASPQVDKLILSYQDKKDRGNQITILSKALVDLNDINTRINNREAKIKRNQAVYDEGLKRLGVCPLCGSKLK
jgi:exonuclease SbcC